MPEPVVEGESEPNETESRDSPDGMARRLAESEADRRRLSRILEQVGSALSHDLQSPVRAVRGFADLVQHQLGEAAGGGPDPDDTDRYLAHLVHSAEQLDRMLQALHRYATLPMPDLATIQSDDALDDAMAAARPVLDRADAKVHRSTLPMVRADRVQLALLLQLLLENAATHRRADRASEIHVRARTEPEAWAFEIDDDGTEIDLRFRSSVFLLFRQLQSQSVPGGGVGLALAERIVQGHGGEITAAASERGGTLVRFTIARARG